MAFAAPAQAQTVSDGGFESVAGGPGCAYTALAWATQNVDPVGVICDTQPRTGATHARLRISNSSSGTEFVTQTVTMPNTSSPVELEFWIFVQNIGTHNDWEFNARVSGTDLFTLRRPTVTGAQAAGYTRVVVTVPDALTDGSSRDVRFRLVKPATQAVAGAANIALDDVAITVVDDIAPDTFFVAPSPSGTITSNTPAFSADSTEPAGDTFECRLDFGLWVACNDVGTPSTRAVGPLADGPHEFCVRATDAAGNTDASPACRTFVVDTTPPDLTIDSPSPGALINDRSPDIVFTTSDVHSGPPTTQCKVDARAFVPCTSPWTVPAPDLADGNHTVTVRSTDGVGLATTKSVTFTVDATPPIVTITDGPAAEQFNPYVSFSFEANEPVTGFECKLDAGPWLPCTSPKLYAALSDGSHTFCARATDLAGNLSDPACQTFTIKPRCTIATTGSWTGTNGNDIVRVRNPGNDRIDGRGGNDTIRSDAGDDCIIGGTGLDDILAGSGNDQVDLFDNAGGDKVKCNDGNDTVYADPGDHVDPDCENIIIE